MIEWLHVALIATSAIIIVLVLFLIFKKCFRPKTRQNSIVSDLERGQTLQSGISRLHQMSIHHNHLEKDSSRKSNYYILRTGVSTKKSFFDWADHPSLITDAVENGWSRFAFTTFVSSSPSAKSILSACAAAAGDQENDKTNIVIGWEVCEGSADYMQKIRFNPGLKNSSSGGVNVIRTALPLPGPHLGNSSFPQEAYFEITILSCDEFVHDPLEDDKKSEGEKIKLIGEDFSVSVSSDSSNYVTGSNSQRSKIEESKFGVKNDRKNEEIFMSIGLTGGGSLASKIPGSYKGSIGFNSSGSVYLDGIKLVPGSEKDDWGRPEKVIGCGYNPSQKKVFFTSGSQLLHEIHCKSDEFGAPLYPTMAANADIMVLVNLGQSPFKFTPPNSQRTPNPCFLRPFTNSSSLGYEDSKEFFSMERIDSQWLQRSATRSNNNSVHSIRAMDYDQESDGDLFEIVLDSTGRSPYYQ